jgi:hypothetical protein
VVTPRSRLKTTGVSSGPPVAVKELCPCCEKDVTTVHELMEHAKLCIRPTACIGGCHIFLRANSDYFCIQHKLTAVECV